MKISKHFEQNVNLGNFQSAKVGLTIHSDKDLKVEEIEEYSNKLNELAKRIVRKELQKIKEEKEAEHDNSA